ncbi:MAG TPA: C39 family peptidase [Phototrophicaceae bacterium]|nr:C39 family peptidase [Phototrophicaceae bacterium]
MKPFRLVIAAMLLQAALIAGGAHAQATAPATAEPSTTEEATLVPYTAPAGLPSSARLSGFTPVYQLFNRCAAGALTIDLSYYGWKGTYYDTIHYLNPSDDDVAVRMDEMQTFAEMQGLKAVYRSGGTIDLLKSLVAAGFPVLVKNAYYDGADAFKDFMGHNRVVMGYDDSKQEFYTFDSLLGNGPDNTGRPIAYTDLENRWRIFNRIFLVLYKPEDEARLQQALGNYWDDNYANQMALYQAQQELNGGKPDSYTVFDMGTAEVALGQYDQAAANFDEARKLGLPWRMMWYQYGPFEAYLHVGRYDDVITLARDVIATTDGVEETYYYAALAYEGKGDTTSAINNLKTAIWHNANYQVAKDELAKLGG